jgi:hypothetical protein
MQLLTGRPGPKPTQRIPVGIAAHRRLAAWPCCLVITVLRLAMSGLYMLLGGSKPLSRSAIGIVVALADGKIAVERSNSDIGNLSNFLYVVLQIVFFVRVI